MYTIHMKQSYIFATVAFIALLAGVIFFGGFFTRESIEEPTTAVEDNKLARPEVTITAKHQWKDGVHTIAGETDMPTPCHLLEWETFVAESFPEQVSINFTLGTQADGCIQVITPTRFRVEFQASERASINATLNGEQIVLNLIEVGPDEDLDDFELFIKG